jgi:hypothetical protein
MMQYHIIFVPCTDSSYSSPFFATQMYRDNIAAYVKAGGKFYVADWAAEWEDTVWPAFVQFQSGYDTPAGATPADFNTNDQYDEYDSMAARAVDPDLRAWLDGQTAPLDTNGGNVGRVSADAFTIFQSWDHIQTLPSVSLGTDASGNPITGMAKTWVTGDWQDGTQTQHPLTVTFEPAGCGRVLYTTYHTTDGAHQGLLPQERILLFLIMQIGVCKAGPVIG